MHDFGGPESLRYESVDDPTVGPGDVLIDIGACGVNRVDAELTKDEYGKRDVSELMFGDVDLFPHVPGIEPAGVVEAVGEDVTAFSVGDRVVAHSHFSCGTCEWCESGRDHACPDIRVLGVKTPGLGGYAEKIALPEENVLALPEGISVEEAASTCVQFGTAWWMLRNAALEPGELLLVTGASGGVGHALTQIGTYSGATVIGTTTTEAKMDWIRDNGADHVIHAVDEDVPDRVDDLTDGRGVDVVTETVGHAAWDDSMGSLAMQGRLVLCGAHTGSLTELDLGQLFGGEHTIMGSKRAPKATMQRVIRLIAEGHFGPVITERYPLAETAEALKQIDRGDHVGRIVVTA